MTLDEFMQRIAGRESGGDSTATNADSGAQGTFQIMPSNWPSWAAEAGIDPSDHSAANQERVARHKMQAYYDQFGDWGAVAVAWYAGPGAAADWLKNPNQDRFNRPQTSNGHTYPSINSYANGVTGGAGAADSSGSSGVSAQSAPSGPQTTQDVLPSDARVVEIDGKWLAVIFDVGDGLFIKYDLKNPYQYASQNVEQMTSAQFNGLGTIVHGGDAAELAGLGAEGKTFQDQWDFVLTSVVGDPNSPALKDPEVRQVIAEVAADEDLLNSPTYIQNRLRNTSWYQGGTDQGRKFNDLSDGDKQVEIEHFAEQIASDWQRYVGNLPPDIKASKIWEWAYQVAAGVKGIGSVLFDDIMPMAQKDENSPLSRSQRTETQDAAKYGNDVENKTAALKDLYARWGIPVSDATLKSKAKDIIDGKLSDADVLGSVKSQAQTMYAWKDPNVETRDAAQPWVDTYARIMEKPSAGIFDSAIQKALTNGTPLWQFEQDLKSSDDWLKTNNARDDMVSAVATMGKTMGFV